jgi:hypothetical protein
MRWVGRIVRIGERRGAYGILVGNRKAKIPHGRLSLDGRTILKWVLKK